MVTVALIGILMVSGFAALLSGRSNQNSPRIFALLGLCACSGVLAVYIGIGPHPTDSVSSPWWVLASFPWIERLGISFHFGIDGLSLSMIILTLFLGFMSLGVSWNEPTEKRGFFHFNLMSILAGIIGVFSALDLFLFYFFWELMLIPMYFLIIFWGHENRRYASIKFFLFTQGSGLLMLISIIALAYIHRQATGSWSFDYFDLLRTQVPAATAPYLMLGFFIAFAVKLPAFPLHTWLPDAHTEAPTAGSVILAGLLLKTGAYGMIRFAVPFFPDASGIFAPVFMTLGAVGIVYGAVLAFAQKDLKRMVAYTSISHLGFVLIGIYAWSVLSLQGAVMQMICHGLSTGALFMLAGSIYERIHTRDISRMGGLWSAAPRMGAVAMFFAMASLGLPGLGNFIAEFLVLIGSFSVNPPVTIAATIGVVFATVYSLILIQRAFHGVNTGQWSMKDLTGREWIMFLSMILMLVWLGLFPQPVLNLLNPLLENLTVTYPMMTGGQLM